MFHFEPNKPYVGRVLWIDTRNPMRWEGQVFIPILGRKVYFNYSVYNRILAPKRDAEVEVILDENMQTLEVS